MLFILCHQLQQMFDLPQQALILGLEFLAPLLDAGGGLVQHLTDLFVFGGLEFEQCEGPVEGGLVLAAVGCQEGR
jgi:hypothetical protein